VQKDINFDPKLEECKKHQMATENIESAFALEHLQVAGTLVTPSVDFDRATGLLTIAGVSMPEDMGRFYSPLLAWMRKYAENPAPETVFRIAFSYFNTATSKVLLELFAICENIHESAHPVRIEWCYIPDDFDMIEAGENYEMILRAPFQFVALNATKAN